MLYKYNFRFNATHSYNKDKTDEHGHTFDVVATIRHDESMVSETEKKIKNYLEKFKNKNLNDFLNSPTIENITEYIYIDLESIIKGLLQLELSDKPTQTYIITKSEGK